MTALFLLLAVGLAVIAVAAARAEAWIPAVAGAALAAWMATLAAGALRRRRRRG